VSFTKTNYSGTGYRWDISNTAGAFNPANYRSFINTAPGNLYFGDTGRFVVRLSLTGDTSCTGNQPFVVYDTLVMTDHVYPLPDTTICPGSTVKLRINAIGLHGPLQYAWKRGNALLSQADSLIYSTTHTDTIVASATDTNSCVFRDTFIVVMKPGLISSMPAAVTACAGTGVLLNPGTPTSQKYLWSTGDTTATIQRSGAGTYWVCITDTAGCSATDTVSLIIVPQPQVDAGRDTTVCSGLPILLAGHGTASNFKWFVPPSTLLSSTDSVVVNPSVTSWYVLQGTTVTNGTTCIALDSVRVLIKGPMPVLINPGIQRICLSNDSLQLPQPANSKPGGTGFWSYPSSPSAISAFGLVKLNQLTTQPTALNGYTANNYIRYLYTDTQGCVAKDSVTLRLHSAAQAAAGIDRKFCSYDAAFTLTGASGVSPAGGVWAGPGVSKVSASYLFNPSAAPSGPNHLTYTYTQQFAGPIQCSTSDSTLFTVNTKPVLTMPPLQFACLSSLNVQLPAVVTNKPGYGAWSHTAKPAATNASGLVTLALLGSQPLASNNYTANNYLTYLYTDSQGCKAKDSLVVRLHTLPPAYAGFDRIVCSNSVPIDLTAMQGGTPVGGTWSGPGVSHPSSFLFTPSLAGTGSHQVIYTTTRLFTGPFSCSLSDSALFIVKPTPVTSAISGKQTPSNGTLESYSVTNKTGSTYSWAVSGGYQSSGGNGNTIAVQWGGNGPGLVAVQETNNGCEGDTVKLSVTIGNTGLEGIAGIKGLSVYPNPTDGTLFIALPSSAGRVSIDVTDPLGRVVLKSDEAHTDGDYLKAIDLSQMSAGVYVVRIIAGDQSASVKVTLTGK
jgi:hypothetical protein